MEYFVSSQTREHHLLHLALQRALGRQEHVLGELLGQRRAALHHAAGEERSSPPRARGRPDRRRNASGSGGPRWRSPRSAHNREARAMRTASPPVSPRLPISRPSTARIWMLGGRSGHPPLRRAGQLGGIIGDEAGDRDDPPDAAGEAPVEDAAEEPSEEGTALAPLAGGLLRLLAAGSALLSACRRDCRRRIAHAGHHRPQRSHRPVRARRIAARCVSWFCVPSAPGSPL